MTMVETNLLDHIRVNGPGMTVGDILEYQRLTEPDAEYSVVAWKVLKLLSDGKIKRHGAYYWKVD